MADRETADRQGLELADHKLEAGSFRDRKGQVFYRGDEVLRGLTDEALADWEALSATAFYRQFSADGLLVGTERVDPAAGSPGVLSHGWPAVLRHERIPFVSYPYEWSFGMLKDAALLQLELLAAALDEDMILKDASSFNVQWNGHRSIFIDIPSIQRLRPGEPWSGYRQFCEMFLIPLMLQAYKDVGFHPWLRGNLDGIPIEEAARLMSARDLLRPGVLKHVYLQSKMQSGYADTEKDVKSELRSAGFRKELISANVRGLDMLVRNLAWRRSKSVWSDYAEDNSYADEDAEEKAGFVRGTVHSRTWKLVWDLGCNTGDFSRIAAENSDYVVAMDADHLVIDRLYQSLKLDGPRNILPLVNNLADPSPNIGWQLQERKSLAERGTPDLTLSLALIHHVVIGANVPMRSFIAWLASLETHLVIEFVTREDPMVQMLLRNKDDDYDDYDLSVFEDELAQRFDVEHSQVLTSGSRILYFAKAS